MSTRTVVVNDDERRLLVELLGVERDRAEHNRLMSRPDSPAERVAVADKAMIESLRDKLR